MYMWPDQIWEIWHFADSIKIEIFSVWVTSSLSMSIYNCTSVSYIHVHVQCFVITQPSIMKKMCVKHTYIITIANYQIFAYPSHTCTCIYTYIEELDMYIHVHVTSSATTTILEHNPRIYAYFTLWNMSDTSQMRTPQWCLADVSSLERCPLFRGWNVCSLLTWNLADVSSLERCPH